MLASTHSQTDHYRQWPLNIAPVPPLSLSLIVFGCSTRTQLQQQRHRLCVMCSHSVADNSIRSGSLSRPFALDVRFCPFSFSSSAALFSACLCLLSIAIDSSSASRWHAFVAITERIELTDFLSA